MLITDLLARNATQYADKTALIAVDSEGFIPGDEASYYGKQRHVLTWKQFNDCANQIANYYNELGIGKGDKVGMVLRNTIEWLPIWFGILKSGAVAVPLNFRYTESDLISHIEQVDITALIVGDKIAADLDKVKDELSSMRSVIFAGPKEQCPAIAGHADSIFPLCSKAEPTTVLHREDMAAIYFSSGTTGTPKAVIYTHRTLEAACFRERSIHHQVHDDCFICIPPLYHVGAKLHWAGNLLCGAPGVLLLGFSVPAFLETMAREKVSIAFLLVPWIQDLLLALETGKVKLSNYDLSHWRLLHMGAQPIPPDIIHKLLKTMPNLQYDISYGCTESGGPGVMNLGPDNIRRFGSIGRPADNWQVKLVDDNCKPVPVGQSGEVMLKGPGMMLGYYGNPEGTAQAFTDGWLHTGDIAREDTDGFYYFVDRKKDIIISGGENICPSYVEDFLREMKEVKDAAVFGIPDERLGEAVVAMVSVKPNSDITAEILAERCCALSKYMRPKRLVIGDVPRNPTGKIDKVKLKKAYLAQEGGC